MQSLQLFFIIDSNCLMQQKKITLTGDRHKFQILKLGFAMFAMVYSMILNQQNLSRESIQNQKSQ